GTGNSATGISAAMQGTDGYSVVETGASTTAYRPANGGSVDCQAEYNSSTAQVAVTISDCG
ncbi:MAG: hypothetical protein NUV55_06475, partial [Sulfuricaulis sp.]